MRHFLSWASDFGKNNADIVIKMKSVFPAWGAGNVSSLHFSLLLSSYTE
jgi:hypothetical protein